MGRGAEDLAPEWRALLPAEGLIGRRGLYPDFLGIGAQKAGTTWLGRNLQAHPKCGCPG